MRLQSAKANNARRGMTLIELLTAMMVSTILIGTAFTTFWTSTQAWEKSKRRNEMIKLITQASDTIERHLRAIQAPFNSLNSAFVVLDDSDEELDYDDVSFLSSANARFPRELAFADLCEIEFYIDTGERGQYGDEQEVTATNNGGLWMRIDATPDDDVEGGGYLICLGEQIVSFNLRFFDGYEWVEEWFSTYEVPEAIEFSLVVVDPEGLENPMSLTRLVSVPLAKTINESSTGEFATFDTMGEESEAPQPGDEGGGQEQPEESEGGSGGRGR